MKESKKHLQDERVEYNLHMFSIQATILECIHMSPVLYQNPLWTNIKTMTRKRRKFKISLMKENQWNIICICSATSFKGIHMSAVLYQTLSGQTSKLWQDKKYHTFVVYETVVPHGFVYVTNQPSYDWCSALKQDGLILNLRVFT